MTGKTQLRLVPVVGAVTLLFLSACGASASPTAVAPVAVVNTAPATVQTATIAATTVTTIATDSATLAATSNVTPDVTTSVTMSATNATLCTRIDLNTVTQDQLLNTLPDFSSRMVREFMEYRPYISIQQFRREIGKYVDDAQVAAWEAFVYVPIDPNNADAETLQQLPGVDAAIAAKLIAGRPYTTNQSFTDALQADVSTEQLTAAACYLEDVS